jgi:hypothetical protein
MLFCFVLVVDLPHLNSLGCFNDPSSPAVLPKLYANFRSQIHWQNMNLTISQCAHVARDIGRAYFGIRFYGECYTAPDEDAAVKYSTQGKSTTCWSGVGSNYASFFYTFNNVSDIVNFFVVHALNRLIYSSRAFLKGNLAFASKQFWSCACDDSDHFYYV